MKDARIEKLAKSILAYSIAIKENDNLLIQVSGEATPLAKILMKEALNLKANVFYNISNAGLLRTMLENSNEEQIKASTELELDIMKKMDACVIISANPNSAELANVNPTNMAWYNKHYKACLDQRVNHTKWCLLRYPTNSIAQKSNMSLEDFENFYFNVCNLDYEKMSKAMDNLVNLMNKTDKVHIISPNTDLTFSIKGIPAQKYDGKFNIPDGEVATAPIRNSVNGYITYNTESNYQGYLFNNIRFEFKDGKIINATSNDNKKLNGLLDTDEGARYIGEFALGLNPYIEKAMGDTLFDEKIRGSFHFTPGTAIEESDNGNRSAIHWDIVNIQTKECGGGEIWFDDVLIRKDGMFVIKELEGLNPENLV